MARKVFLSILGKGYYKPTKYYFDGEKSNAIETNFIQEASLRHYPQDNFDKIYIFLTKDARTFNWENPAWRKVFQNSKFNSKPEYEGLSKKLEDFKNIETIDIDDGNNESEIWSIFETIFKELNEGDQLYFDITHGFRTLPMLLMVLINYSKFLKNIEVEKITYGNWEARDEKNNFAPVIDVTSFSKIQDWTNAASEFINGGSAEQFVKLSKQNIAPVMRETKGQDLFAKNLNFITNELPGFILNIQTNRGNEIVSNKKGKKINDAISKIESDTFTPITP
ncbi:MAG: TIGR02221 family CRISPR-associated protein, partial [Bacteroidota bacterium]|nr:TIGR02221 family CRISPR-associated protein [Bacteroidota bacterium]